MERFKTNLEGPARATVSLAETTCKIAERQMGLPPLWDWGLGAVTQELVKEAGIPEAPFTAVQIARAIGLLRPEKKVR